MPEVVKKQGMGPGGNLALVLTIYSEKKASLTTLATGQSQSRGWWAQRPRKRVLPVLLLREMWCFFPSNMYPPIATKPAASVAQVPRCPVLDIQGVWGRCMMHIQRITRDVRKEGFNLLFLSVPGVATAEPSCC